MKKLLKKAGKAVGILGGVYALLFVVFYFDLDGKFLYYVYEPAMIKHYDNMDRKSITDIPYGMEDKF